MYGPALLFQGRASHQMSGQEVEWSTLLNHQPQAVRKVWGTGFITPERTGREASVGTPIPWEIRHPWLGHCGPRAGRLSPFVAGNSCLER
jgi:hypothetical protein